MKNLLPLVFTLLLTISAVAQSPDTALANSYLTKATEIVEKKDAPIQDSAVILANEALTIFLETNEPEKIGLCYKTIALGYFNSKNHKKAISNYLQAIPLLKRAYGALSEEIALVYDKLAYIYYLDYNDHLMDSLARTAVKICQTTDCSDYALGNIYQGMGLLLDLQNKPDSAILAYNTAITSFEKCDLTSIETQRHLGNANYNLARVYSEMRLNEKANQYYKKAIELGKKTENTSSLSNYYSGLGLNYKRQGDYLSALEAYQKGIALQLELPYSEKSKTLANLYNNVGIIYRRLGEPEKSFDEFEKAITIEKNLNATETPFLADIFTNIGSSHINLKNFNKAEAYFIRALNIRKQLLPPNHPRIAINNGALGMVKQNIGQYKAAINYYKKANKIFKSIVGEKHPRIASGYLAIAFCYYKLSKLDLAIENYTNALIANNYHEEAPNRFNLVLAQDELNTGLREISRTYHDKYIQSGNPQYLALSTKYIEEAVAATNFFKANFKSPASKKRLMQTSYLDFTNLILNYQEHYKKTDDPVFIQKAFQIAEQAKSNYLLEHLSDLDARYRASIPDSLIEKAQKLENEIAQLERKQFEAKKGENDSLIHALNSLVFDQKETYSGLKEELEKNYPDYTRLRHFQRTVDLNEVQANLSPNQAVIEFVLGENDLYTFALTPDSTSLVKTKLDSIDLNNISSIREHIFQYWLMPPNQRTQSNLESATASYVNAAAALHKKLIQPLGPLPDQLTIIPSGILGYLPFEILLTEKPSDLLTFKSYPYLINDHQITYNFSATLWQEMTQKESTSTSAYCFAPSFTEETEKTLAISEYRRNNLGPLVFNTQEAETIGQLLGAKAYTGTNATKEQFLKIADNAAILHLATHAKVDDSESDFSYLAFTSTTDSLPIDKVYIRELYGMQIPAQMVVLSACETGIGELQEGEGIISLARGFAYAGAASIITSLWAVNDQSTATIMTTFYDNLVNGQPKDAALRNAKLDYIQNASDHLDAHPFKWAPFIVLGDTKPIEVKSSGDYLSWLWLAGLGVIILSGIFYLLRRKKV